MKRLVVIFLVLISLSGFAQTRRALVVGIGTYPEASGWNMIHGDNDVGIICSMLEKAGFEDDNVQSLVNEQATFANIVSGLAGLSKEAGRGDVIYIHLSGHGQLMTDLNGDEPDNLDESFVPYDAAKIYGKDTGDTHLTDDILNAALLAIRRKIGPEGRLLTVIDACHSGSGARREDVFGGETNSTGYYGSNPSERDCIRGTSSVFTIPVSEASSFQKENKTAGICIYACAADEFNFELNAGGHYYGRLSSILYHILEANPGISVSDLEVKVREEMGHLSNRFVQTPVFEYEDGIDLNSTVLGRL